MNRIIASIFIVFLISNPSKSEDFPNNPITMVVPYSAGGTTDVYARLLAERLRPVLGQPVLIENRPGASQMIGAQAVATAESDGYTLLFTAANTMTSVPLLFNDVSYRVDDFTPVSLIAGNPYALVISNAFEAATFEELIERARQNPGEISYATTGFGTGPFLGGKALEQATDTELLEVPFRGLADASAELTAGRIDLIPGGLPEALLARERGNGRILAVFDDVRAETAPDVPTTAELGYPDLVIWNWFAVFAPAGTPAGIIDRLNEAIAEAASDEEFRSRLMRDGMVVQVGGPDEVAEMIAAETESRRKLIEDAGIEKQ